MPLRENLNRGKRWVISRSGQALELVQRYNACQTPEQHRVPPFLYTADCEWLYINLDQQDLIERLSDFLASVFAQYSAGSTKIALIGGKGTVTWSSRALPASRYVFEHGQRCYCFDLASAQ